MQKLADFAHRHGTGCDALDCVHKQSGSQRRPLVSLLAWRLSQLDAATAALYAVAQCCGAVLGVWLTHAMFSLPIMQISHKARNAPGLWLSELVAAALLLATIRLGSKHAPDRVPMLVALIVTAGYWFTSSTFFANPAVTLARSLSDSFAGIAPGSMPGFLVAQLLAALLIAAIPAGAGLRKAD